MNKMIMGITSFVLGAGIYITTSGESAALQDNIKSAPLQTQLYAAPIPDKPSPAIEKIPANGTTIKTGIDAKINKWVDTLSKEKGFESWNGAEWTRYPLGPGTHGWVVLLTKEGKEVGYLIISSTPEGDVQLSEYGLGERPMFSQKTLYQTLVQHGLISANTNYASFISGSGGEYSVERIFINSLHAVWRIAINQDSYFFDAKTGELLPLTDEIVAKAQRDGAGLKQASHQPAEINGRLHAAVFDPFERVNWITNKPMSVKDFQGLQKALHHETQITFAAHLFNRSILAAFAVTGFQQWNDGVTFVSLDQDGFRYILYEQLIHSGSFYQ